MCAKLMSGDIIDIEVTHTHADLKSLLPCTARAHGFVTLPHACEGLASAAGLARSQVSTCILEGVELGIVNDVCAFHHMLHIRPWWPLMHAHDVCA